MASKAAKDLAEIIVKSLTAGASAVGSTLGLSDNKVVNKMGGVTEFLAAQIDVAYDLVSCAKEGKISKGELITALAAKSLAATDLFDSDTVQCFGAVASMAVTVVAAAAAGSTPVGWAFAVALLADVYGANIDCKVPAKLKPMVTAVKSTPKSLQNQFSSAWTRFEHEFMAWLKAQGGVP